MADATTLSVLITARDQASAAFQKIEGNMGKLADGFAKHRKSIGVAATAIGGLITGIAAMSVKSSLDQQVGIRQLDAAMQQTGTSYAENKKQIEELVAAQQRKTNFGDEEQRKALLALVLTSGSYDQAMRAMIPTMELAAGREMELSAAAILVARAISGEETALGRYGVAVEKGAGATAVLTAIMAQYAGQAEAAADPTRQLGNRVGDLFQAIGDALVPMMEVLVPLIDKMVEKTTAWAEAHPVLTKVLVIVATAIGGILLVVGPLLLLLPTITVAIGILSGAFAGLSLSMGPITLIVIGITSAIAAGILIWKKWDTIVGFFKEHWGKLVFALPAILGPIGLIILAIVKIIEHWDTLKKTAEIVINAIIEQINWLGRKFSGFVDMVRDAMDKLPGFIKAMIPGFDAVQESLDKVSDKLREGIQPIEFYNEKQEELADDVKRSSEKVVVSVERQQKGWEDTSDVVDTEAGKMKRSSIDLADVHGEQVDRMITKEKERRRAVLETAGRMIEAEAELADFRDTILIRAHNLRQADLDDQKQFGIDKVENAKAIAELIAKAELDAWEKKNKAELARVWAANKEADRIRGLAGDGPPVIPPVIPPAADQVIVDKEQKAADAWVAARRAARAPSREGLGIAIREGAPATASAGHIGPGNPIWERQAAAMRKAEKLTVEQLGFGTYRTTQTSDLFPKGKILGPGFTSTGQQDEFDRVLQRNLLSMAHGGITRGGPILVGERGPEILSPPAGSRVTPNSQIGGGTGQINFIFHGDVYGVDDLREVVVEAVRDHALSGGFAGVFGEP